MSDIDEIVGGKRHGWIGVDLDGTLAYYDKLDGITSIGEPIPDMVSRVKKWIADGWEVRVFTARMFTEDGLVYDLKHNIYRPVEDVEEAIGDWTEKHVGTRLLATCVKDFKMVEMWDDRAVQVEMNTGQLIGRSTRGL